VPDPEVPTPQAKSCNECQFSVRGSGMGGTGTACRLSWRIAVVLPNDPAGDVMQMVLPATSTFGKEDGGKWPFRPYVQMLANNNVSAGRVVTKMQFDPKSSVPKFNVLSCSCGRVDQGDLDILQKQAKSEAAERAIKLTVYQSDTQGEVPSTTTPEPVAVDDVVEEPVKREEIQAKVEKVNDVSDIVKKWSTKD
jgi:hypothetical protein